MKTSQEGPGMLTALRKCVQSSPNIYPGYKDSAGTIWQCHQLSIGVKIINIFRNYDSTFFFFGRYDDGRIIATQGQTPERFYYIVAGRGTLQIFPTFVQFLKFSLEYLSYIYINTRKMVLYQMTYIVAGALIAFVGNLSLYHLPMGPFVSWTVVVLVNRVWSDRPVDWSRISRCNYPKKLVMDNPVCHFILFQLHYCVNINWPRGKWQKTWDTSRKEWHQM